MAHNVAREIMGRDMQNLGIIDTSMEEGKRPTTIMTEYDALKEFAGDCLSGKFPTEAIYNVFVQSNQPYVDRQVLGLKRAWASLTEELDIVDCIHLEFNGAGQACEVSVAAVNSELGALALEQYFAATVGQKRKRSPESLMFQSRQELQKNKVIPPFPDRDQAPQNALEPGNL